MSEPKMFTVAKPNHITPLLSRWRRWFDGDNADDTPPENDDTPPPEPAPGKNGGQEGTSFTQRELDSAASNARKDGEERGITKLLADVGLDNPDALKTLVTEYRQRTEADKSELEKAQDQLEVAQKESDGLKEQLAQAEGARRVDKRDSTLLTALKLAEHPQDVLDWLKNNKADDLAAVMSDDGAIDAKKVTSLVEAVKGERPKFFTSSSPGSPSMSGGKPPLPDKKKIMEHLSPLRL